MYLLHHSLLHQWGPTPADSAGGVRGERHQGRVRACGRAWSVHPDSERLPPCAERSRAGGRQARVVARLLWMRRRPFAARGAIAPVRVRKDVRPQGSSRRLAVQGNTDTSGVRKRAADRNRKDPCSKWSADVHRTSAAGGHTRNIPSPPPVAARRRRSGRAGRQAAVLHRQAQGRIAKHPSHDGNRRLTGIRTTTALYKMRGLVLDEDNTTDPIDLPNPKLWRVSLLCHDMKILTAILGIQQ